MHGLKIILPLRLVSVSNIREHYMARARRAKAHRRAAIAVRPIPLPADVTITRIAPRPLDTDNLASACKALRDGIADRFGVADNHPDLTWHYAQRRGRVREHAVEIAITPRAA